MLKDWNDKQIWLENKELDETRKHINNLDFLIEIAREELFDNNCDSNKKWLEELKENRKNLINKKENMEKN